MQQEDAVHDRSCYFSTDFTTTPLRATIDEYQTGAPELAEICTQVQGPSLPDPDHTGVGSQRFLLLSYKLMQRLILLG